MTAVQRNHRRHRHSESGYALALTVIMLIPLLAIAAIGVDIGIWYVQAQQNQRVADAAALAGVVWLPDKAKAQQVAMEAVRLNGLDPGVDSSVSIDSTNKNRLRVSISTKSTLSFSGMFLDEFSVTRASEAEYNPPIPLGSPENQLGNAALWLAVSGRCSLRENGDLRSAQWLAGYPGGAYPPQPCIGSPNPNYDSEGYLFAVEIAVDPGVPVQIQAYDAAYDPASISDIEFRPPSAFNTEFTLYDKGGAPFDLAGQSVLGSLTVTDRDPTYANSWQTVAQINNPEPGTYYFRVRSTGGGSDSFGSNGFSLRAFGGPSFYSCSTLSDPSCIQVAAVSDLSLYASLSGGSSTFFLADIGPENGGKQLKVNLFDVGEGADQIEILDPNGNPAYFDWSTDCSIGPLPLGGCSGSGTVLDVSGSGSQIFADTLSTSRYNDRTVVATVDLPSNYASVYSGNWWQIRYTFGTGAITDRTTWSVFIIGDPVRLTR